MSKSYERSKDALNEFRRKNNATEGTASGGVPGLGEALNEDIMKRKMKKVVDGDSD